MKSMSNRNANPGTALFARVLGIVALAFAFCASAQTPAGTVISNTASVTATAGVTALGTSSNTVTLTVGTPASSGYAATLATDQLRSAAPGATVDFPHLLTNIGLLPDSYSLAVTDLGIGFTFTSMALYADANGDGVPDSLVPIAAPVALNPGQAFRFVVRVVVPGSAVTGVDDVRVSATSVGGAAIVPNVDRVSLGGALDCGLVTKQLSVDRGPSPGGPITVTLPYNTCDKARQRLVLTDTLPAGMRYVPGSARWSVDPSMVLTDASNTDLQGSGASRITYDFGVTAAGTVTATITDIPGGVVGNLSFQVEIVSGLAIGAVVDNGASYTFWDASGARGNTTGTNRATYTVNGTADLELTGQRLPTATPGSAAVFTNVLTNRGNLADTFDITLSGSTFPPGTTFALFKSDGITPLADTDGNGTPDTGVVAPGASYNIIVRALIPSTALPAAYKVVKTARSVRSPARFASADDAVDTIATRCAVALDPDNQSLSGFGRHVTYTHFLTNRGNCSESVTASVRYLGDSRPGWKSTVFLDNQVGGGASIPGALDPTDTPVVQGWTTTLAPGQGLRILVDVLAPTEAEMNALKASGKSKSQAKAVVDTNVTTVTLDSNQSGALVVRDTTSIDDNKDDATDNVNTISNYTNNLYTVPTLWAVLGGNAYLRANAPACNAVPEVVEQRTVVITGPNGEREEVIATETGANTGIFMVPVLPVRSPPVVVNDRVLQGTVNTVYTMDVIGCGRAISGVMTVIDASSIVFDSVTNAPIPGASVSLVAAAGNSCSTTPVGGTPVVTGSDGRFRTTSVPAGRYCLRVTPTNGYSFPSTVPWTSLPAGRNLEVSGPTAGGSYGQPFQWAGEGAIVVDLPLDSAPQDGLFVQKAASRTVVELGDFVDYVVAVRNNTGNVLDRESVVLIDKLPAGFAYVRGTAMREGLAIADPAVTSAGLVFQIGTLARGQLASVRYRVRTGPGSLQGDGINRAHASYSAGGQATVSNEATARVLVVGGVFSERGFILGKVFLDCNTNGVQNKGEPGLPGVRLFTEDGTYVVTDGEGKYSFYGLSNRTHVLKLDRTTLPKGAKLEVLGSRNLGDGGSRIVDLTSGELHRGDFAVEGCAPALVEEAKARAQAVSEGDPLAILSGTQLMTEGRAIVDPRTLPASGLVVPQTTPYNSIAPTVLPDRASPAAPMSTSATPGATSLSRPALSTLSAAPAAAPAAPSLEQILPGLDADPGFVGLKDGDILPMAQATVRVKGAAGTTLKLTVNGREVADKQVGKRAVLDEKKIQGWEYVGVELRAGENELVMTQVDAFGNARGTKSIRVKAPGRGTKLSVEFPDGAGLADGKTPARVLVKLTDAAGVPVTSRTPVTLVISRGQWLATDADPALPGVQSFIENGAGEFTVQPPLEPGSAQVTITAGDLKAEGRLDFLPNLRSLVASGVLEGIVNMRNISSKALVPTRSSDAFEQEIQHLSRDWNNGKSQAGVRAAFFLKGKIKGDYLLTAAYDSDKDVRERLFRDIQPDEFYPVYGDSAVRGYDAQSTSRLYVRVDKNRSYLLWGDYTTQSASPARKLSAYSRSLTGVQQHYENSRVSATAFASRDTLRQVIEELRANGTSGPFQIANNGALVNSEKVEILTRDRNQTSIILSALPQARFSDYEIEALTGRILFKSPIPSVDRDLNPVSIRITYEVDQGGEQFWVMGGEVQVKVTDRVEVGGVYVKDKNPQDPFTLAGANATVKLAEKTFLIGEVARTERGPQDKTGDAARLELTHESENLKANAFVARTDKDFDNQSAYLSQGRGEAGGKVEYRVREGTMVRAEALRTEDLASGSVRDGVVAAVSQKIGDKLLVEVGVRHSREKGDTSPIAPIAGAPLPEPLPTEVTTVRARVTGAVPGVANATVYGEAEVDVKDTDRRILAAGGEYMLPNKGRLYARHEFISSITGPYGLNANERQNTTAVGIDTEYMTDGRLFSEYRIRDALGGGDAEAAFGLKNLWTLAPGLRLGTQLERVHALSGTGQNENTAIALALDYTANPLWKGTTRLEWRNGATQDSVLSTIGFAAKINKDWTALVRNAYSIQRTKAAEGSTGGGDHTIERLQAGVAYRDTEDNKWNALGRVEHKMEDDASQSGVHLKTTTEIVSVHADWQPIRPFVVTGRYAAKWTTDRSNGLSTKYRAQVVGAKATWEFAPKWDVSLVTSALFGDSTASRQYGVGLELGYLVATNLWVSGGYNFFGYRDTDLAGADYTAKGPFVRLRYKFDESLFESAPAHASAPAASEGKAP
ncbi:hypothetical protein BWI17_17710 [Betaproteobacteria bacterium GR16-43]|nr:hypothetical protein BWI17_17710 [Betaproteobacteria bacterium GR16-43]